MSEDMHSLLGKYFSGQATGEETEVVKKWIQSSVENEAEFNELERFWNKSEEHEILSFDKDKAWQKVNAAIRIPAKKEAKVVRFRWKWAAAAAACIVLALSTWLMMNNGKDRDYIVLAESDGKVVVLPDGSKVYLRKFAKLDYPSKFDKDRREVSLTGEAFFEITPNPSQPFGITASGAYVEVVGTSFSVNTTYDEVKLVVKTGKVNFGPASDKSRKILVTAGERALFANNEMTRETDTDVNSTAWISKRIVFKNTPLQQIATTLSDYYKVNVSLNKEDAAQIATDSITIEFNNQPLQAVLNELSLTTTYRIEQKSKDNYEISIK
jgi:ferric-dicitrate binding protein FerR (iron transport regulator)